MATVVGVKIKTKPAKIRNPLFADEKYTGPEPEWPSESSEWPDDKFDNWLRRSFYYYNYYYNQKDCKKHVVDWMRRNSKFTKEDLRDFERSKEGWMPMTACSLIMANRRGMPFREKHLEYVNKAIAKCIKNSRSSQEKEVVKTPEQVLSRPTIQDRLTEKTNELIGELEGMYDDIDKTKVKFYDWFTNNNVVQGQLGKYESIFQQRKQELEEAQAKKDPQLKEAYSHYKAADFKRRIEWIDDLFTAIDQYRGVKKATKKARVKKAPNKEKIVAKLNYSKEDKQLKIVSINPVDIIGAQELWVYNASTRKLGKYVAMSFQSLGIKGSTLVGFDPEKSVGKTLRKPEEQLRDFAKAGKIALRTFLKDIRAVEVKLNGRINKETLLLRVG